MILIDNRNMLRVKSRELLQQISKWDDKKESPQVMVEKAKTGVPTMKIVQDGKTQYLQSKYDPEKEAIRFVGKYAEESIKHVLFVGIGTGIHINKFIKSHPDSKFSIYEPNEEVLYTYLSNFKLEELSINNLLEIFTGTEQNSIIMKVQQLLEKSNNILKIVVLPVYEKVYGNHIQIILEHALQSIKEKHNSLATNTMYQKRWTINSIKNFPIVLQTPNILHDIDQNAFEGKPAIIVAAGPSLNEEFENLRYIKKHGLAYIFSVGSSINALIEKGIYPDAACTYDPQDINYKVIKKIIDKEITEIPLIFGSSVGFETLKDYPGDMLHMIVNQDTIASNLLKHKNYSVLDIVNDAPSIAVVTLQLLMKLKVSQVILVGQNLAYSGKEYYARGIDYGNNSSLVNQEKLEAALVVKDVYGNDIKTTYAFNLMKQQLEMYIALYPQVKVWNTTKGGAAIHGAEFKKLEVLLERELTDSVVMKDWSKASNNYFKDDLICTLRDMNLEANILEVALNKIFDTVKIINQEISLKKTRQLERKYAQLDNDLRKVKANNFYYVFIEPMVRVQSERLSRNIQDVRHEKKPIKKAEVVIEEFTLFIAECAQSFNLARVLYKEMENKVESISK